MSGTFKPVGVDADSLFPARVETRLAATYAKMPGPTRNALTGWFHADGLGAVADGTTNNTTVLQNAVNAIIAAGGGKLYLPLIGNGRYRLDSLTINGHDNVNLTIEGAEGTMLLAAPGLTSDFITIDSQSASLSEVFIRRVTLRNLNIQGNAAWNNGTKINRRGVVIGRAQDIRLDNVKISQFKQGALILDDVWDSVFNDVEIKWSGYGTDSTNYAYALQVTGTLDNSNANKFKNLHMEFCPLLASFDHLARHNMFYGSKFEHGGETETNASGKSPLYFGTSIETTFENCFFTENKQYDVYFIRSDANTDAYLSTYALRKRTTFIGCEFFAISTVSARWYSGTDTQFLRCGFQRTNGATTGVGYAFDFEARNALDSSQVAFADAGAQLVRFQGSDNAVRGVKVFTASGGSSGSVVTLGSSALRAVWDEVSVLGGASSLIATTLTYLGNNVFRNTLDPAATFTGGGAKSVLAKLNAKLNDASAQTYTNFLHAWSGQTITVTGGTANQTIQNNANIVLRDGADRTLAVGESITLTMAEGVWREPNPRPLISQVPASGQYIFTSSETASGTSAALGIGTLRVVPWYVPRTLSLSQIGAEITTVGDAGSKFRLGIYADNGNGYPGALVVDAGQIAGDSATVQQLAVTVTLPPGLYWIGGVVQAVTTTQPTVRVVNSSWVPPVAIPVGTTLPAAGASIYGLNHTSVTGALPTTFQSTISGAGAAPRVFVKVA